MKLLEINLNKLAVLLLATFERSTSVIELLRILYAPFSWIQKLLFDQRTLNIYKISHNGQVFSLRKVLNDKFPVENKVFEIIDAVDSGAWQYAADEETFRYKQLMIQDESFTYFHDEETMTKFADFVVRIPIELQSVDNLNRIKAIVNTYKLISKKAIYEYY